jgi:tRNA1Val (adenine37-N6)-methyltransferase
MSSENFVFKKFEIKQDKCAMKVGTDAVLLGSWSDAKNANSILDIGTGTGILALMLAQKSSAKITAIDIDNDSYLQAKENVQNSIWSANIVVKNISIQDFVISNDAKHDVIITNPPYFTDAFKAKETSRNNARHTDELPFEVLINCVCKLLSPNGFFYIILPYSEAKFFMSLARTNGLFLLKSTRVKTKIEKEPKRLLMKYSFTQSTHEEDEIVIENDERHNYTKEYIELTKDYYLDLENKNLKK